MTTAATTTIGAPTSNITKSQLDIHAAELSNQLMAQLRSVLTDPKLFEKNPEHQEYAEAFFDGLRMMTKGVCCFEENGINHTHEATIFLELFYRILDTAGAEACQNIYGYFDQQVMENVKYIQEAIEGLDLCIGALDSLL